jgi:hypothetical protein
MWPLRNSLLRFGWVLYAMFSPLCQRVGMDLGFSRRSRLRDQRQDQADQLGSLLANIAARQALTPTARAHSWPIQSDAQRADAGKSVDHFAPAMHSASSDSSRANAFNPMIAVAILTDRQPS